MHTHLLLYIVKESVVDAYPVAVLQPMINEHEHNKTVKYSGSFSIKSALFRESH